MSRPFEPTDLDDTTRIWRECGWIPDAEDAVQLKHFFADTQARVAEVDGAVECVAASHTGSMRYENSDINALLVTAVTTSWLGRKRGLARRLTAEVLADGAAAGNAVATLGIFEHGFYNTLGFGSGPYEHMVNFDPATLHIDVPYRTPVRLTIDDHAEVADALQRRVRSHGGFAIDSKELVKAELGWLTPPFALGYRDESGRLTHFVWGRAKGEYGPYRLNFVSYETPGQLMELLAMLKALGDQVRAIRMAEPAELQLQDLVRHPFRAQTVTKGGDFEAGVTSNAWWQIRMLDVSSCFAQRSWSGTPVKFNLALSDPLDTILDGEWTGVGGDYVVEIGENSSAKRGRDDGLPQLTAGVGALTRMWVGAAPASALAFTDELDGPEELLAGLDAAFGLPVPRPGIYY